MQENYHGGGARAKKLSRSEIIKMKKNMQKAPHIQLISEKHHHGEAQKAEELLEKIGDNYEKNNAILLPNDKKQEKKKGNLFKKITKYLFG